MINIENYYWAQFCPKSTSIFTKNSDGSVSMLGLNCWGEISALPPIAFVIEKKLCFNRKSCFFTYLEKIYNYFNCPSLKIPQDIHCSAILNAYRNIKSEYALYVFDNGWYLVLCDNKDSSELVGYNMFVLTFDQLHLLEINVDNIENNSDYVPLAYELLTREAMRPLMDTFIIDPGLYEQYAFGEELFCGVRATLRNAKSVDFTYGSHNRHCDIEENHWVEKLATLLKNRLHAETISEEWNVFFMPHSQDRLDYNTELSLSYFLNGKCIAQLVDAFIPCGTSIMNYEDRDVLILRYEANLNEVIQDILDIMKKNHNNIN